jgi:hypothetical protein
MSMWWDYVSELQPPMSILFIGRMIMSTEENWFVQTALWQTYRQNHLIANHEELGELNYEFGLWNIFVHTSKRFREIFRHGVNRFASHPKEGVLRIFIALKTPSPWPGSNPWTLCLMAITLTITPPRRPNRNLLFGVRCYKFQSLNNEDTDMKSF